MKNVMHTCMIHNFENYLLIFLGLYLPSESVFPENISHLFLCHKFFKNALLSGTWHMIQQGEMYYTLECTLEAQMKKAKVWLLEAHTLIKQGTVDFYVSPDMLYSVYQYTKIVFEVCRYIDCKFFVVGYNAKLIVNN